MITELEGLEKLKEEIFTQGLRHKINVRYFSRLKISQPKLPQLDALITQNSLGVKETSDLVEVVEKMIAELKSKSN